MVIDHVREEVTFYNCNSTVSDELIGHVKPRFPRSKFYRGSALGRQLMVMVLLFILLGGAEACTGDKSIKKITVEDPSGDLSLTRCEGKDSNCASCILASNCPKCFCKTFKAKIITTEECNNSYKVDFTNLKEIHVSVQKKQMKQTVTPKLMKTLRVSEGVSCGGQTYDFAETTSQIPLECHNQVTFVSGANVGVHNSCSDALDLSILLWINYTCYWPFPLIGLFIFFIILSIVMRALNETFKFLGNIYLYFEILFSLTFNLFLLIYIVLLPITYGTSLIVRLKFKGFGYAILAKIKRRWFNLKTIRQLTFVLPSVSDTKLYAISFVALLFSHGVLADVCSTRSVLSSVTMVCATSENSTEVLVPSNSRFEECWLETSVQLSMTQTGMACIKIEDKEVSDRETILTARILGSYYLYDSISTYYTNNQIELISENHFECFWGGGQCTSDTCERSDDYSPNPFGQIFSDQVISRTGRTLCERTCQCSGCHGCFYCVPACVWSRYVFNPAGKSTKVTQMGKYRLIYETEICLENFNGTKSCKRFLSSKPVDEDNLSFHTTNVLVHNEPSLPKERICEIEGNIYFCDSSPLNSPKCGTLGMIQARSGIDSGSTTFLFDDSCVIVSKQSDRNTYQLPMITSEMIKLPHKAPNSNFIWESRGLIGELEGVTLTGVLSMTGELKFTRLVDRACPTFDSETSVNGTWGSSEGFCVSFSAHSKCGPGAAHISSDPEYVFSPSQIVLTPAPKIFKVCSYSGQPQVSTTFFLGKISQEIRETLRDPVNVGDQNTTLSVGDTNTSGIKLGSLEIGLIAGGSVLGLVLLLGIAGCVVMSICPLGKRKMI